MLTINRKILDTLAYPINQPYKINEIIFFDIETTGLSANTSFVYLIGCITYDNNSWKLNQWLLEDPNQEKELLNAFSHKIKSYKRIIHYNGNIFDIPYLKNKYNQYNIPVDFSNLDSLDLYKAIRPYKKLFSFPNLQLKTIEKYLGYNRQDQYSGRELITTYQQYIGQIKYESLVKTNNTTVKENSSKLAHKILLHNAEDIASLLKVAKILAFIDFFKRKIVKEDIINISSRIKENMFLLNIQVVSSFPYKMKWSTPLDIVHYKISKDALPYTQGMDHNQDNNHHYTIELQSNNIIINMPIINSKLKYFFENYKDYYYLPKEDMAIHKSVALYVDKEYKLKAKPSNCYTYMEGSFILAPDPNIFKQLKIKTFKDDYKSNLYYIELSKLNESDDTLLIWTNALIDSIISGKETTLIK